MKTFLLVGHSQMTARNMARDLIDSRGETVYQIDKHNACIKTEEGNLYVFLAKFEVRTKKVELRGMKFDEIYYMGDFSASLVEALKGDLGPIRERPGTKEFLLEPENQEGMYTFK